MTSITTTNPARSDVHDETAPPPRRAPRVWAAAGAASGLAGIATIALSSAVDVVYRPEHGGSTDGVAAALVDKAPVMLAFHSVTVIGALPMIVFAAGLHRRLRAAMTDSLVPLVAAAGLVGTAVVSILGSALDTEFMVPLLQGDVVDDASAAMYNHWIGTVPWLWTLAGLAGVGLFAASRRGVVARWLGLVGLVLGGLTLVLGISPMEYMAGVTGAVWLVVTGLGLTFGDRRYRALAQR
ncbi:hypothetical protein [Cellulomonas alba]|uniref:DUF4386 domain-containing protein n=1 Tax=Cellulomonas alba TaxID=3053467 RepID=A0ABT7SG58_9CELL|nr:hypothetical protein [Cellulomonas alba]MDM7854537.1 hypothetical protein [Cellulomonas alba]